MLLNPEVKVVYIATPHYLHAPLNIKEVEEEVKEKSSKKRLYVKNAEIVGKYETRHFGGEIMIRLDRNASAFFNLDVVKDTYYNFKVGHTDLIENCPPRLECLVDHQVIGTTYFSRDNTPSNSIENSASIETLGTQFIPKGSHKLEIRAMFEPTECVEYIEVLSHHRKVEKPLFSFVVISDTHIHDINPHPPIQGEFYTGGGTFSSTIPLYGRDGAWEYPLNWINRMLYYKMPAIMEKVVKEINGLNPDLVIHTGDLSGEKKEYLITAKSFLDKLNCPYHISRGNHDRKDEMLDVFSMRSSDYSFDYKNFHFIIMDRISMDEKDKKELEWLENDLNENQENKTFIFTHPPLLTSDNLPVDVASGKPYGSGTAENSKQILNLLDRHANIKAVFAGHGHINELIKRKGVYYFQTSALCEYPMLYRQVVIFSSHIEVRSYQVDKSFLKESFLTTPDNIFNSAINGWVIGKNSDIYSEIDLKR